ncbi:solute carrier family 2, facilitated glucose transporter member 8-like, partial [Sitodiplosis mosellana]|uniref:solute carrier family 2, facilitated glucose transporter member 8-like n=1 Tax=Sitodiplosis mosellana TaxID=263140 RepID=UPI002444D54C
MIIVDTGLTYAVPTILIAAMTGISNEHNRNEYISITPVQASWLGSISSLVQPFGSLLSAFITDSLGRKLSMILVNIPYALGWFMIHQGDAIWKILTGCASFGLGIGLMEAPIITYLGEICEPSTRGVLVSLSFISVTIGTFLGFFLNTMMSWRTLALVCLSCPIITAIAICF